VIVLFQLAAEGQECFLRGIEVWVEEKQEIMAFVTNHLKLAASTIAVIYKERWQIELFFQSACSACSALDRTTIATWEPYRSGFFLPQMVFNHRPFVIKAPREQSSAKAALLRPGLVGHHRESGGLGKAHALKHRRRGTLFWQALLEIA
jgi:hypothetical protein